jgi:hypothetical protein
MVIKAKACDKSILVTDHQRRPNDRFVLSEAPVENRQSTHLCESNLFATATEGNRMLKSITN